MRKSNFSEEQIINVLKSVESGQKIADACRTNGISEQTYHR
jgi:putative transposase